MKKSRILIFVDNGQVWNVAKVQNHNQIEIIVINNDSYTTKILKNEFDCDQEVEDAYMLAKSLEKKLQQIEKKVRGKK